MHGHHDTLSFAHKTHTLSRTDIIETVYLNLLMIQTHKTVKRALSLMDDTKRVQNLWVRPFFKAIKRQFNDDNK